MIPSLFLDHSKVTCTFLLCGLLSPVEFVHCVNPAGRRKLYWHWSPVGLSLPSYFLMWYNRLNFSCVAFLDVPFPMLFWNYVKNIGNWVRIGLCFTRLFEDTYAYGLWNTYLRMCSSVMNKASGLCRQEPIKLLEWHFRIIMAQFRNNTGNDSVVWRRDRSDYE